MLVSGRCVAGPGGHPGSGHHLHVFLGGLCVLSRVPGQCQWPPVQNSLRVFCHSHTSRLCGGHVYGELDCPRSTSSSGYGQMSDAYFVVQSLNFALV